MDMFSAFIGILHAQIDALANRTNLILAGRRTAMGDSAIRIGYWLDMAPQFWTNLQTQYGLALAEHSVGATIRALRTVVGVEQSEREKHWA